MQKKNIPIFKPYNHQCKCIYIHIPKVAGISIEKAIFKQKVGHKWALMYKGENKILFNEYFKFSFVRNPYDRLASAFHFLKNGGRNEFDKQWSSKYLSNIKDLQQFIKMLKNETFKNNVLKWTHFIPQYKYVCDTHGNLIVDFIGKFENIRYDFNIISKKLNIEAELTHENKTKYKQKYQELYTQEMQEIVSSIYIKDFELFNYDFKIK